MEMIKLKVYLKIYIDGFILYSKMYIDDCDSLSEAKSRFTKTFFEGNREYIELDDLDGKPVIIRVSSINAFEISEYSFPTAISMEY